jgi:plasmid replication initiation protein
MKAWENMQAEETNIKHHQGLEDRAIINNDHHIHALQDEVREIKDYLKLQKTASDDLVQTNQSSTVSLTGATLIGVASGLVAGVSATLIVKNQFA